MIRTPKKPIISTCSNKIIFFLHDVFILKTPDSDKYRLLVIFHKKILIDKLFPTIRGARISFSKRFHAWIKPNWSHFYPPDIQWLYQRLKIAYEQAKG